MRNLARSVFVVITISVTSACGQGAVEGSEGPGSKREGTSAVQSETGNGAPSGEHFTLNVIGKANARSSDGSWTSGHRIFVPLNGGCKILLTEGDFAVLDADGTDGEARFSLPRPDGDPADPDYNDGITSYTVVARALGTPGGHATVTTCALDEDGNEWCNDGCVTYADGSGTYCTDGVDETVDLSRIADRSRFINVSRQLLYVYADMDYDGTVERYPLFDDALESYLWDYDNNGLRIAQLRFYPGVPTNVN